MQPVNYDGRYHGPVLFRDALANSYNIPPIQLLRDVGIPSVLSLGRQMGIESLRQDPDFYGLSLTLGGGEVPLLEMTHAYATLANGGAKPKLMGVLEIRDNAGNLILDQTRTPLPATQVIDPRIAYIMSDILSDNRARTPAMGANSVLKLPFPAAAKTGTTNDYRDNWTIGYTPGVVVGVWSGNADGSLMNDSSGLFGAAPIWNQVMQGIYGNRDLLRSLAITNRVSGRKELPPTYFDMPDGVEVREVCLPRGTGGTRCTASRPDLFIYGAPTHGIARLGYAPDVQSVPGAWSLGIASLPSDKAQAIWDAQPDLPDGSRPPRPTTCALNRGRTEAPRLLLPIPPYYPDEVQARLWAGRNGYAIAPAAGCPIGVD
jgi:membrane peptidoglycan carboxypeptidase